MLDSNTWNHLTVRKQMSSCLFNILPTYYSLINHIYSVYIYIYIYMCVCVCVCVCVYKLDLTLNTNKSCYAKKPTIG